MTDPSVKQPENLENNKSEEIKENDQNVETHEKNEANEPEAGVQDEQENDDLPENAEATENDMDILNRIYMGELENLPPQASKLVRIFTSSTFTGKFILLKFPS
jgi:hypothetical protein